MTAQLPRYSLRRDNDTITVIVPELAKSIGLNESIVLMQIGFLAISDKHGRNIKGVWWTYGSIRDLQSDFFPYWGISTLNRAINNLAEKKLIFVTDSYNQHAYDRTRWFTLNLAEIAKLSALTLTDKTGKPYPLETWEALIQNETPLSQSGSPPIQNETPPSEDPIQDGSTIQNLENQTTGDKDFESVESRARVHVRAKDLLTTHTHTARIRSQKRMASTSKVVDTLTVEEPLNPAATAQEPPELPIAPLSPSSAPPPFSPSGTGVPPERQCTGCLRPRPRSAFFRAKWKAAWARDDQLEPTCALCRLDEPHMPADDLPTYRERVAALGSERAEERAEERSPLPRHAVQTFGAAGALSKAQADMTYVAAHPLWLAFRDEWRVLTAAASGGDGISLPIDKPTRYRETVESLDSQHVSADEVHAFARDKWAAGKGDYDFAWMKGDIARWRAKRLAAKGTSGTSTHGNTLDRYDLTTIGGCDAALADNTLVALDRRVVEEARARLVHLATLPLEPPNDYYPPMMWDDPDPDAARRAMWTDQRTRRNGYVSMTREESRLKAGLPAEAEPVMP